MALISSAYDVGGGETRSSVITDASYVELHAIDVTLVGRVMFWLERKQSTGAWIPVRDGNGKALVFGMLGNDAENGMNVQGLGGADFSVRITPLGAADGNISLDAITDGTIT